MISDKYSWQYIFIVLSVCTVPLINLDREICLNGKFRVKHCGILVTIILSLMATFGAVVYFVSPRGKIILYKLYDFVGTYQGSLAKEMSYLAFIHPQEHLQLQDLHRLGLRKL